MEFKEAVEFTVQDAELEFSKSPVVDRVILKTDAVPRGRITIKPRKKVEKQKTVDGMPGTETSKEKYEATELPENVQNVVKRAQEQEITCTATLGQNEEEYFFILDEHLQTLEARLLQDDRDE